MTATPTKSETGPEKPQRCKKKNPPMLRRNATVRISTALEADTVVQWSEEAKKDRLAHRGQTGKIVCGGKRQEIFGVKTEDNKTSYYHPSELTGVRSPRKAKTTQSIQIQVRANVGFGNHLTLQTSLNWDQAIAMKNTGEALWEATVMSNQPIEFKTRLNGTDWEIGENHKADPGSSVKVIRRN